MVVQCGVRHWRDGRRGCVHALVCGRVQVRAREQLPRARMRVPRCTVGCEPLWLCLLLHTSATRDHRKCWFLRRWTSSIGSNSSLSIFCCCCDCVYVCVCQHARHHVPRPRAGAASMRWLRRRPRRLSQRWLRTPCDARGVPLVAAAVVAAAEAGSRRWRGHGDSPREGVAPAALHRGRLGARMRACGRGGH